MQRHALGLLFLGIAAALLALAIVAAITAGGSAAGWIVAVAAVALGGWMASLAASAFRRR